MSLRNLENNLDSVKLLLLSHHLSHQKFEKGHLGVAFLVLCWIFLVFVWAVDFLKYKRGSSLWVYQITICDYFWVITNINNIYFPTNGHKFVGQ